MTLDKRLNAYRDDLADVRLCDAVPAPRYVEGRPARVVAGLVPVRRSPSSDAPLDTFYLHGEPVWVFDEAGCYAWCQSQFDGYVGYAQRAGIAIGEVPAPTHFVATLGSYRYPEPDLRSPPIDFVPRHGAVTVTETGLVTRGTEYARIDHGGFLALACLSEQPPRSVDIAAAFELYLGCPYLWGGRSWLGIDCSGLVQAACRDIGVVVLRDTDMQQATIGEGVNVETPPDLRRGDLLYLPGHVLLYAGDGAVIHADGATMTVRRDRLVERMRARSLDFEAFVVRRLGTRTAGIG